MLSIPVTAEHSKEAGKGLFAHRHFRELIQAIRQPGSDFEPWLADALTLLVEQAESFRPPDNEDAGRVEYVYPH